MSQLVLQYQTETLQHMAVPSNGCTIFVSARKTVLDVACAGKKTVKLYSQLHVQHNQPEEFRQPSTGNSSGATSAKQDL